MFLLIAAPCDCSLLVRPTLPRILALTKKEPKTPLMTMARAICYQIMGGVPVRALSSTLESVRCATQANMRHLAHGLESTVGRSQRECSVQDSKDNQQSSASWHATNCARYLSRRIRLEQPCTTELALIPH